MDSDQDDTAGRVDRPAALPCDTRLLGQAASLVGRLILNYEEHAEPKPASNGMGPGALDFYGGYTGLAFFWAAMARSFPAQREEHGARSLAALQPARRLLAEWIGDPERIEASGVQLGGLCGLGGAIYALTCAGVMLAQPDLLAEAIASADLLTPERLRRDLRLDLVEGAAGTLLALVALDQTLLRQRSSHGLRSKSPRRAAVACAQHLLAQRSNHESAGVWVQLDGRPYCGFAHGASGILYSLVSACAHCAQDMAGDALDAARCAIAFERSLYRPRLGNWQPYPGFREAASPVASWCWGAPGIALARIAGLHLLDDETVRADIRDGLATTYSHRDTLEDHICCGNLGRALILDFAARTLGGMDLGPRPNELRSAACAIAHHVLRRAKGRGGFGLSSKRHERTFSPYLFKGAAGLGFAFLYLARPDDLPLPLLVEPPPGAGRV